MKKFKTSLLQYGKNINLLSQLLIASRYVNVYMPLHLQTTSFVFSLLQIISEKMKINFYLASHDLVKHASWLLYEALILAPFTMEEKFLALKLITFDNLKCHLPSLRSGLIMWNCYIFMFTNSWICSKQDFIF